MRTIALSLVLLTSVFVTGCDSPAENAKEEQIEDKGEAAGMSEDKAEAQGEAVSEGKATDTTGTYAAPATDPTVTTTQTTATTATTT